LTDYALLELGYEKAYLDTLYIDPKYRRAGLGTYLIQAIIKEARELEITEIIMHTTLNNYEKVEGFLTL